MADEAQFQHPRFVRMYERIGAESQRRGSAEHRELLLDGLTARVSLRGHRLANVVAVGRGQLR
jgi:hypothetical protein